MQLTTNMKPNRLLIVSILAVLAGGCASDFVTTSPDRYYYPDLHNHVITRIDGQKQGALPRNPPAIDAIVQFSSGRRGEEPFAGALKDGTDGFNISDNIGVGNTRFCCFSDPRQ